MSRVRQLLQSAVLVVIFSAINKVTGLYRVNQVGAAFGTTPEFDAFTSANQLPEVFFTLIAGGALAAAFIPVYSNFLTGNKPKVALRIANTTLTLVLLVLIGVAGITAVLAPWLCRVVLVPDFPPEQQLLTAQIMRIILLQTIIFGVSGVFSSILNAHQHFALPAAAPIALDVGYLIGLWYLVPTYGIFGLAWGTVLAAFLHLGIQVPALLKYRIGYTPQLALRLDGVREIIRLMGPRVVMLGAVQVADLIIIRITSGLPDGSTSAYFYAFALMQIPETLFGTAIAIVLFPTMAEQFNAGNIEALKRTATTGLSIIWSLTIPSAVAIVFLGQPLIVLLLEGGAFDAAATTLVFSVLLFFSVRIVSEATLEIVARLFYAQHDTRTPMTGYLLWLLIQGVLAYVLVGPLGISGLALASTIAFTFLAGLLFILNRRQLGGFHERELLISASRGVVAATGMGVVLWLASGWFADVRIFAVVGTAVGGAVYIALNLLLGGQELPTLWRLLRRRNEH